MSGHQKNTIVEKDLVAGLKLKDKKCFDYLYENYSNSLYTVCVKVVGNIELAEDSLQESFIKIWTNILTYDESKGRLFTWMLNITRNTALDKLKSKHLKYKIQTIEKSVNVFDKQQQYNQNTDTIGVKENVGKLSEEHRNVIELAYFGGFTHEEIAKELNMPLGSVKTRIRSAMSELRKLFTN
jgi:RNA polymerase sigma-70 factor, ECF subfamily